MELGDQFQTNKKLALHSRPGQLHVCREQRKETDVAVHQTRNGQIFPFQLEMFFFCVTAEAVNTKNWPARTNKFESKLERVHTCVTV